MITYAEANTHIPFDWNKFLARAIKRPDRVSARICERVQTLSSRWTMCACGVQCAIIPRDDEGAPRDKQLNELGLQFHYAIEARTWYTARAILDAIERRSSEVIAKIQAKKQPKVYFYRSKWDW